MTDELLDNPAPGSNEPNPEPSSILDSPAPDNSPPQTWPDAWRSEMAGGDEKYTKQLERFNSPQDFYKSHNELQKAFSSRQPVVEKPGADADEGQVKAYRESLGIPDDPSGYDLNFDDGTVIGEDIKPLLDGYLKHAHESNIPPDVVKNTLGWYMKDIEAQNEARSELNEKARIDGITDLKAEWGGEFQGNMNAVHSLFTQAPEGTMEALLGSAGEDGLKFANNPDNIRWLVGLAKELNPTATLVPPGPDQAGSISAEIDKIQKIMNSPDKTERDKYWKDPAMQKRFSQLSQAKQAG